MYIGFIYKISNSINEKLYIGQTSIGLLQRWRQHCKNSKQENNLEYKNKFHRALRKYGDINFKIEVVAKVTTRTLLQLKSVLNHLEIYYIDLYDSYHNGYNSSYGGDINPMWNVKGSNNPCSIKINQYSISGEYIRTWDSIADISRELQIDTGNICKVCSKNYPNKVSCKNFIWRYFDEYSSCENLPEFETNTCIQVKAKRSISQFRSRAVAQYTLDGDLIKTYETIGQAAKETNSYVSAITNVCKGIKRQTNQFMWKYIENNTVVNKIPPYHKRGQK